MKIRNGLIDFYRFIFALIIVSYHSHHLYERALGEIPFIGGDSAVEFFFILSGFFLMKKASQNSSDIVNTTWNEIFKKVKMLYPAFLISYGVALVIQISSGERFNAVLASIGELLLLTGA